MKYPFLKALGAALREFGRAYGLALNEQRKAQVASYESTHDDKGIRLPSKKEGE